MISAYHLRTLMRAWSSSAASAQAHRVSPQSNVFSYRAARDVEVIVLARRELASLYLSRIERNERS